MSPDRNEINRLIARERVAIEAAEAHRVQEQRLQERLQAERQQAELQSRIEAISRYIPGWIDAMAAAGSPGLSYFMYRKRTIHRFFQDEVVDAENVAWNIHSKSSSHPGHYHGTEVSGHDLLLSPDGEFFINSWSTEGYGGPPRQFSLESVATMYTPEEILSHLKSKAEQSGVEWDPA